MRLPPNASPRSRRGSNSAAAYHSIGVPIASPVVSPRGPPNESEYFYTLVFPNTKAQDEETDAVAPTNVSSGGSCRISYADALATLRAVTAGGKEREAQVVGEFKSAWMAKFRTPPPAPRDTIPLLYFQELLRELIVQRFDAIADLFLKTSLSQDQRSLLISFRPSKALLCATADRLQMKVAIMGEIDPGEAYWGADATRAASESYQWSKADAQEELYRMFLAGKISTEDAQLFDDVGDKEDSAMWSRRIHALRRFFSPEVAKAVAMQDISATTYLPFKNRASLRYLYRQIDGTGDDATPFRVVDKIRLTKAIIDAQFDCDALVEKRLLVHHCCMHTHHTDAIDTSIDVLRVQWGALSGPLRLYRQGLTRLSQLLQYQPIAHVRNYFGEELALYFAYTSFYASALQMLCLAAVAAALLHTWNAPAAASCWYYIAFAVLNTVFTQSFVRKWEIQERTCAMQWGVLQLKSTSGPRPQFRGELALSPVTHRLELFYSPQRRQLQRLASAALLCGVGGALLCWDFVLLTSNLYAQAAAASSTDSSSFALLLAHWVVAVLAKVLSGPFAWLCKVLTEWENYKTQQDFDFNLTLKFAVLQTVNLFGAIWVLAFVLPFLPPPTTTTTATTNSNDSTIQLQQTHDAHQQAAHLLLTFLSIDLAVSMWDLRHCILNAVASMLPPLHRGSSFFTGISHHRGQQQAYPSSQTSALLVRPSASTPSADLDAELALAPYEGVMFDYAQVTITFGFIAWFAALAPLATLLAWAVAVVQIRVDAYKLCALTQRPFPSQQNSIGSWATYLRVLAFGSWLHNAMFTVLYLSSTSPTGLNDLRDFLLLRGVATGDTAESERLACETLVLVVFGGFGLVSFLASVHDQSDRAQMKQLYWLEVRHRFLENKYINNLDQVPDSIRDALPSGRVFLNGVHVYVVTGNKAEEDAAEEILDELVQYQLRCLHLEKQIAGLREADAAVGSLVVEIGSINILPIMDALTKAVDSFLQLQLTKNGNSNSNSTSDAATKKAKPSKSKDKPVNTSVVKKNRSPQWTESFELTLSSLDDTLLVRVFDWELLGTNRRIGRAMLDVSDIVATAQPSSSSVPLPHLHAHPSPGANPAAATATPTGAATTTATASPSSACPALVPPSKQTLPPASPLPPPKARMASFEIPIEMPEVLLSTMQADLVKHGHPKLSLRCGVQLDALGRLLLQQRNLQAKIRQLKDKEKQFFQWK